jgi:hypothetical protein
MGWFFDTTPGLESRDDPMIAGEYSSGTFNPDGGKTRLAGSTIWTLPLISSVITVKLLSVFGPNVVLIATSAHRARWRSAPGRCAGCCGVDQRCIKRRRDRLRTRPRNPSAHPRLGRRYRPDSRCSTAPGCSCSDAIARTSPLASHDAFACVRARMRQRCARATASRT